MKVAISFTRYSIRKGDNKISFGLLSREQVRGGFSESPIAAGLGGVSGTRLSKYFAFCTWLLLMRIAVAALTRRDRKILSGSHRCMRACMQP